MKIYVASSWNPLQLEVIRRLREPGFEVVEAIERSDWYVIVAPCGSSALEAGYSAMREGKGLVILLAADPKPGLFKMADAICISIDQLVEFLCDEAARKGDVPWAEYEKQLVAEGKCRMTLGGKPL